MNDVVPELPSFSVTSLIESVVAAEVRGFGGPAVKSAPLVSVSVGAVAVAQPPSTPLTSASGAAPSKQFVPVP